MMLNGQQIVQQNKQQIIQLPRDLKKKWPQNTPAEINEIESLQENLLQQLLAERIERTVGRARAIINATGCIEVQQKLGKWNTLGYTENRQHFLHYHEALYLIEMNRLELKWDSVIVSVEQGYTMLLDTKNPKCNGIGVAEYVVYAQLQRCGFNVQLHDNENSYHRISTTSSSAATECVWKCLAKILQSNNYDCDQESSSLYSETLKSMNSIADRIKLQIPVDGHSDSDISDNESSKWNTKVVSKKRTANNLIDSDGNSMKKKLKRDTSEYQPKEFLNILLKDVDSDFEDIFDQINVIKLMPVDNDDTADERSSTFLKFVFDVYEPNAVYKKSDPSNNEPKYKVIIVRSGQSLPTRQSIVRAFLKQSYRSHILVVFVNDVMAMHAFLYQFSV